MHTSDYYAEGNAILPSGRLCRSDRLMLAVREKNDVFQLSVRKLVDVFNVIAICQHLTTNHNAGGVRGFFAHLVITNFLPMSGYCAQIKWCVSACRVYGNLHFIIKVVVRYNSRGQTGGRAVLENYVHMQYVNTTLICLQSTAALPP